MKIEIRHLLLKTFIIFSSITLPSFCNNDNSFFCPIGKNRTLRISQIEQNIIGYFGDRRVSNVYGHKHAGIDIKGSYGESVYPITKGKVVKIFRDFPNKTICIKHFNNFGDIFYSMYIHLEDIQVSIGDYVYESTYLGRIFNIHELEESEFETEPHLHLEIRHSIDDGGKATFGSMNLLELKRYCIDPLEFFKIDNKQWSNNEK